MESCVAEEIKQMCVEYDETWFLTHSFPKRALGEPVAEEERSCSVYDETEYQWIFPNRVRGKLPGFMLVTLHCNEFAKDGITDAMEIYFAFVKPRYRRKGVLKSMLSQLPWKANVWLDATSTKVDDIETVWQRCGFGLLKHFRCDRGDCRIYKRIPQKCILCNGSGPCYWSDEDGTCYEYWGPLK